MELCARLTRCSAVFSRSVRAAEERRGGCNELNVEQSVKLTVKLVASAPWTIGHYEKKTRVR